MPPLPRSPVGIRLNAVSSPQCVVELFLDLSCPFSKKMYKVIYDDLCPYLEAFRPGLVQFVFHNVPQPWHAQSSYLHEASLAVKAIAPSSFGLFCKAVFENSERFVDSAVMDKTRNQIYSDLAELAVGVGIDRDAFMEQLTLQGEGNAGIKVTQEMKFAVKYHRTRGVHVTPTVHLNGLEASQVSSSWTLEEWKNFLTDTLNWGGTSEEKA